jgi:hypothetical protein
MVSNPFGSMDFSGGVPAPAKPREAYVQVEQEISDADALRRRRIEPNSRAASELQRRGAIADPSKFSATPGLVRFYRITRDNKFCEPVDVPVEFEARYRSKREKDRNSPNYGSPIFHPRPPRPLLEMRSEPCQLCGIRMVNNYELIKHYRSVHPSDAAFFLSQEQIDLAKGELAYKTDGIRKVLEGDTDTILREREESIQAFEEHFIEEPETNVREAELDADDAPLPPPPTVDSLPKSDGPIQRGRTTVPHIETCKGHGRFGRYTESCTACQQLKAQKQGIPFEEAT